MRPFLRITAKFFFVATAVLSLSVLQARTAAAQSTTGNGWWLNTNTPQKFASADAACRSQWQAYGGSASRFLGAFPAVGNPNQAHCDWTRFGYFCTGGGVITCGTTAPSSVWFYCAAGYQPVQGKFCAKDPVPERPCECNNGSSVYPQVGNPIALATGSKTLKAVDYETADNEFRISRSYRSLPIGRSASFQSTTVGLAGGWNFDFAFELQLGNFSGSEASPSAKLALISPDGTGFDFQMQAGGAWAPDTTTGAFYAPKDVKIEYVGSLPADLATLQSTTTQWKVTDAADAVWIFQTFTRPNSTAPFAVGRPISKTSRNGYRWDFAYRSDGSLQTVTDSFSRVATFNWSLFHTSDNPAPTTAPFPVPEAVSSVSLPDGTSLRYTYDPPPATTAPSSGTIQRLVKVERLDGASTAIDSTTYTYSDTRFPQHLTGVSDFSGMSVASYTYDDDGRATSTTHAGGVDNNSVAFSETATELVRTVTNPLQKVDAYRFQRLNAGSDSRFLGVDGAASANVPASTRSVSYGTDNFIQTVTDAKGNVTSYARDSRGRPTTITEAVGTPAQRSTTISWHANLNVPSQEVRPGLQTDYQYYPSGQLQSRTETDTTSHSVPYATAGQTRTFTYTWGTGGRLASINGPKPINAQGQDDVVTFNYDVAGNLLSVTNALGHQTSFSSYDANGRPGTMTDPNGVVTEFTYSPLGFTKTVKVKDPTSASLDALTSFDYDVEGRVTGITLPSTTKLILDYNLAGQLTVMRVATGERIDFQNDSLGNVTSMTVKRVDGTAARSISRTFDELGRMLTETLGPNRTTSWAYDKNNNPQQMFSARNYATQTAFDPLDRLVSTVTPDGGDTILKYNARDELTSHTDPIAVETTFVRNGFGEVIQEVSPDGGTSIHYYDQAGDVVATIDGRGQRVDLTRDILGRITKKQPVGRPATETITYAWDTTSSANGIGRLLRITQGTDIIRFSYDHRGNVITKQQMMSGMPNANLRYAYDLADRVSQITYPSGRLVEYVRDTRGRVSTVRTKATSIDPNWTTLVSSISYEPWGAVRNVVYGNGLTASHSWGNDGRLANKRLLNTASGANLSRLDYSYDNDDNIIEIADAVDPTSNLTYAYDNRGRLSRSTAVSGTTKRNDYLFDKNGNRTAVEYRTNANDATPAATDVYANVAGTNRLATITTSAGVRTIGYDLRGNTLTESRLGGISVAAGYDGHGRLLTYARTGELGQENVYNGLDERVRVTTSDGVVSNARAYMYDQDHRLIGEYGATLNDPIAETIWLMPDVANANLPMGGDDGIGGYAPLSVVSGSASNPTLTWVHGNHLGVPIVRTNGSGAAVTPTGYTMPGYPGQLRTLSDLYYNRHRDYDSSTGRYLQADPIGLEGGSNLYLYADGNPHSVVDPHGLNPAAARGAFLIGEGIGEGIVWWCRSNLALCARTIGPPLARAGNTCNALINPLLDYARKASERNNYKNVCSEPPPPGLSGKDLQRWKLKKAMQCWKLRQEFTNKWHDGKFDSGHSRQMEQLREQISNLVKKLGL